MWKIWAYSSKLKLVLKTLELTYDIQEKIYIMQRRMSNPSHLVRFNKIQRCLQMSRWILVNANTMNFTSCNLKT
ncbi:hypothetical protein H5410_016745 [Solanum commersonii]|uniref:Uncharacterized protein n=1 Tax=Solanum commersonii TaxID=4109 RepID=A0A9J5ZXC2_SOLCO|nr:hypothetical protein H5410_016745 [Solanum commersonii]